VGFIPITLPKSQEVVLIQPISPFLLNKISREYPAPTPPMQRVSLGTPENPHWEESPNESHPDYIAAREAWSRDLEEKIRRFTVTVGTRIEWNKDKKERLAELRANVEKTNKATGMNIQIEEDDDYAYVNYIALQTGDDYQYLLKAIMEGSRPTEGAITEAAATFRPEPNGQEPHLQGEGHI
jgi:predicted amino acid-binding ACT domain protein